MTITDNLDEYYAKQSIRTLNDLEKAEIESEEFRAIQNANRVLERILKHVGVKCPHCIALLQRMDDHWCDRCGDETDTLEIPDNMDLDAEQQLCKKCMEHL